MSTSSFARLGDLIVSQGLILAWLPRVDGVFLKEAPQVSVLRGHVSNVPMITGVFRCRIRRGVLICFSRKL